MESTRADVVVIGAGLAGLAAAVRLAEHGLRVVVLDEAPRLGGRATSFTDRATGERVDNGQHVVFGCYRETYAFLRVIGAESTVPLQQALTLPMIGPDGAIRPLACPALPPPWHLVAGVLRWRAIPLADRMSAVRMGRLVREAHRDGAAQAAARVPEHWSVSDWLVHMGQSAALREWLWHPLAIAALNQAPEVAAAPPFVRVVAELFGRSRADAAVGLARLPLEECYGVPARRLIEGRGGEVRLRTAAVVDLDADGRLIGARTPGGAVSASAVISSVPWHAFGRLWADDVPEVLRTVAADAAAMASSPIVTVNLWFDASVMPAPFIGMVDGPMHWAFDKRAIFGDGRIGHVSVVASGAEEFNGLDNEAVSRAAVEQLSRVLPTVRAHPPRRSVVVRERRATFSLAPGAARRPAATTGLAGFYLAGDWTDTGLPATIEGAVLSGHRAADLVLGRARRLHEHR